MNSTSVSGSGQVNQAPSTAKTKVNYPKVVSKPFAKLYDWITLLPISGSQQLLLAELIRYSHDRCFTWVGNSLLGLTRNVKPRQIQKLLRKLQKAKLITIREYGKSWCKTQRIIFVNSLAEEVGIDPLMELPTSHREFFSVLGARNRKSSADTSIGCPVDPPTDDSSIGCPVGHAGDVPVDTRRDQKDFLPLKRQRKSLSGQGPNHRWPEGRGSAKAGKTEDSQSAQLSEAEQVRQSQSNPSRPAMDWPSRNLPTVGRAAALAKKVWGRQVTHVHPEWLKTMGCWAVRFTTNVSGDIYHQPKVLADGFIEVTGNTIIVPLIDSENRRVTQAEFIHLLKSSDGIKAPDIKQPVIERTVALI
jgi:hypothetical protein